MMPRSCSVVMLSIAIATLSGETNAQAYPTKVLRYVITDVGGSATDVLGRIIADGLGGVFGHQVIVDNRPGAGGNIGAEFVAHAPADGYTILQIATTHAANATLFKELGYNLLRDFAAVTQLASAPSLVVVPAASPVKSIGDLINLAKSKPGEVTYASAGSGTCGFLGTELFRRQAGLNMVHVPYKGGAPGVTSVVAGETMTMFPPIAAALGQVNQGKLRVLAVTSAERLPMLPDYPTIAEAALPGYEFSCWYGLVVPAKTPRPIIDAIQSAVAKVLRDPAVVKRLGDMGFVAVGDRPDEFDARIKSQIEVFRPITRDMAQPQ